MVKASVEEALIGNRASVCRTPRCSSEAARQDLREPVAEGFCCASTPESETASHATAEDRRDQIVSNLRCAATVTDEQRGQDEPASCNGEVTPERPSARSSCLPRSRTGSLAPRRCAVPVLVPRPAVRPARSAPASGAGRWWSAEFQIDRCAGSRRTPCPPPSPSHT